MPRRAAIRVLAWGGVSLYAQLDQPPVFDDKPAFKKNAPGPIDSSSHIAGKAEAAASALAAQVGRFAPATPSPRWDKALALFGGGHLAAAAAEWEAGARQAPDNYSLLAGAMIGRFLTGHADEGAKAVLELVKRDPRDTRLIVVLGETAAAAANHRDAYLGALRQFAKTFPRLAEPRYYLAQLVLPAEAAVLWKEASVLDPKDARPCLELARVETNPRKAIGWLEEALRRNAHLPDAHYRLWRLYARAGNQAKATEHLDRYRQLRTPAPQP